METITIQKNKLPEGWEIQRLGEIAKVISGGTPSRSKPEYWENGTIPWLKISDLKDFYIKDSEEKINQLGLENSSAKLFPQGTILFTVFATLGNVAILNIDAATNQAISGIFIKDESKINKLYLVYYLKSLKETWINKSKGVTQNNINQTILKETLVPIPPIELQQKIVQKLDAFFESYNKLKQEKQKAKEKYEQILQSALVNLIETKKLSKGWEEKTIGELFDQNTILEIKSGFPCGKHNKSGKGIIHIRPMNVNTDGQIELLNCKYVEYNKEYEDYLLKEGDVIFNNTNSRELVGKTACFKVDEKCLYSNHMTRIRVDRDKILPEFLSMYLHNLWKRGLFNRICHSHVSQASVNTNKLKEVKIVLPTIEDQKRIVHVIENTVKKFQLVNTEQKNIDFQLSQLPKAVLSKAFKGELVSG